DNLLLTQVELPESKYEEPAEIAAFYERAIERVRALPGVESAGLISMAPFSQSSAAGSYAVDGYEPAVGESAPHALRRVVDDDYFETMGITLLSGRGFDARDTADSAPAVVVDRLLVEKYFPESDPLAGRVRRSDEDEWMRIVGVVE